MNNKFLKASISHSTPPLSPCVGLCKLVDSVCSGCFRTMEQISGWSRMSNDERQRVINSLPPSIEKT
ncbi:DUF1289 domain-containing protein [Corallincola platygyrae]